MAKSPLHAAEIPEGGKSGSQLFRARNLHLQATAEAAVLRRRAVVLPSAPTSTSSARPVVLQADHLNVVASAPSPAVEVQVVRDADAGMRAYVPVAGNFRTSYYRRQDFVDYQWPTNALTGTGQAFFTDSNATQDANHPGVFRLNQGAGAGTAYAHYGQASILLGNGWTFETLIRIFDATGTISRIGWNDGGAADAVDGLFFEYDKATSANWRIVVASNSVRTRTTTSIAVSTSAWTRLKVTMSSASNADFYVNGALAGSFSSGIPTAAGRDTGFSLYTGNAGSSWGGVDCDMFEEYCAVSR